MKTVQEVTMTKSYTVEDNEDYPGMYNVTSRSGFTETVSPIGNGRPREQAAWKHANLVIVDGYEMRRFPANPEPVHAFLDDEEIAYALDTEGAWQAIASAARYGSGERHAIPAWLAIIKYLEDQE